MGSAGRMIEGDPNIFVCGLLKQIMTYHSTTTKISSIYIQRMPTTCGLGPAPLTRDHKYDKIKI